MSSRSNPYPGPRSFMLGERLYGRERETEGLLDLLIAERIVLLYSPSGAGKTSLLQAGLIPSLRAEGFRVLPPMRVNASPEDDGMTPDHANRYVLSCLASLEEGLPKENRLPINGLGELSLDQYLLSRASLQTQPGAGAEIAVSQAWHGDVLIFDQFEEVLTLDPTDRAGKAAFFEQVGQALRNRSRWAIFAMREEFIAGLDPYLKPIPSRFDKGRRYRLELLSPGAAMEAIQQPARQAGVEFSDAAAQLLADNLAAVRVQQPDGSTSSAPGDAVEPVQLQVVCFRLWEKLAPDNVLIDVDDIEAIGDVDSALRSYYAETVAGVAARSDVPERTIRDWVEGHLIIGQDFRGQVLQGPGSSNGLANRAIWELVNAHLLRAEQRRGATWFELAHDRLVQPVREDNAAWRDASLSSLQRSALHWQRQGKPTTSDLLLSRGELAQAERWARTNAGAMSALDHEFMAASHEAQRKQRMRRRLIGVAALAGILLVLTVAATSKLVLDADAARRFNRARAVAAQARIVQYTQPDLALLLGVEAPTLARSQSFEIAASLLAVLEGNPQVARVTHASDQAIKALAIDGEHKYLAAGDDSGRIALYDLPTMAELDISPLQAGASGITDAAMAPHRPLLAAADRLGGVTLWDLAGAWGVKPDDHLAGGRLTGTAVVSTAQPPSAPPPHQTTAAHAREVNALAFSPDGLHLATVGRDEVRLWAVDGLALSDPVTIESGQPTWSAAFSPADDVLAVGRSDGVIALHNLATGQTLALQGESGVVNSVAFNADGRLLAAGVNVRDWDHPVGIVQLWDLQANMADQPAQEYPAALIRTLHYHTDAVERVVFSSGGPVLASAGRDSEIYLWNVADELPFGEPLRGHLGSINDLAFEPNSLTLFSAGDRGEINQWLLERRSRLGEPWNEVASQVWRVAFPPGDHALVFGDRDGLVWIPSRLEPGFAALDAHDNSISGVAFSPDGARMATASYDGTVILWAWRGEVSAQEALPGPNWVNAIAYSPATSAPQLAAAYANNQVLLWDLSVQPAVSSTLSTVLAGAASEALESRVAALAFDPQGKMLYGGDNQGRILQWDMARRQLVEVHTLQSGMPIYALAIDPSGQRLAVASSDNGVYLRRLPGLQPIGSGALAGHTRPVSSVVFHPNGKLLASASHDGAIILWDAETQQQIGSPLKGHGAPVNSLAFSSDGEWLASAGDDGRVILWPMTQNAWIAIACQIAGRTLTEAESDQYLDGQAAQACRR